MPVWPQDHSNPEPRRGSGPQERLAQENKQQPDARMTLFVFSSTMKASLKGYLESTQVSAHPLPAQRRPLKETLPQREVGGMWSFCFFYCIFSPLPLSPSPLQGQFTLVATQEAPSSDLAAVATIQCC